MSFTIKSKKHHVVIKGGNKEFKIKVSGTFEQAVQLQNLVTPDMSFMYLMAAVHRVFSLEMLSREMDVISKDGIYYYLYNTTDPKQVIIKLPVRNINYFWAKPSREVKYLKSEIDKVPHFMGKVNTFYEGV